MPDAAWGSFLAASRTAPEAATFLESATGIYETKVDPLSFAERFWDDWPGAIREVIDWPDGMQLIDYQEDVLRRLYDEHSLVATAPHGSGKSGFMSLGLIAFGLTRDAYAYAAPPRPKPGRGSWKAVTTAGSMGQLYRYLWPEINLWLGRVRWDRVGFEWRQNTHINRTSINGFRGQAFARSCTNTMLIEGAHAPQLFFGYDEAKAIPGATFDATEGAFSDAWIDGREAFRLAGTTPGYKRGRVWDMFSKREKYAEWSLRPITLEEAIRAKRISAAWAERKRIQWGETSFLYLTKVRGEFALGSGEDVVIPDEWLEAAFERGEDWLDKTVPATSGQPVAARWDAARASLPRQTRIGCDVGGGGLGQDPTILCLRHEHIVPPMARIMGRAKGAKHGEEERGIVSPEDLRAALVKEFWSGGTVVADAIAAASAVTAMKRAGLSVVPFNGSLPSSAKDVTGQFGFLNLRAEAYYGGLRAELDPTYRPVLALARDETLAGELLEIRFHEVGHGRIRVEEKDEIAKRVRTQGEREDEGGSTNRADALSMTCWSGARSARGGISLVNPTPRIERIG